MMRTHNPFRIVRAFEAALCDYTGARYCVTTTSCTMALLLSTAYHLDGTGGAFHYLLQNQVPPVEIPKRTYVGVPYAIREAGARITFRDEDWSARGHYQLAPLPVYDSARWLSHNMMAAFPEGAMVCVSFHWGKTLGIQQGGAILHSSPDADWWLRRARFDGREEGTPPSIDGFPLRRAWHAYMAPETAAAGLVRLANLPLHNAPLPWDAYPDLSTVKAFQ